MAEKIQTHYDLDVFSRAFDLSMQLFELSKQFPSEEKYSLTDQLRRASRSVCSNLAEAWRKRRYEAAFVAKLSDAEAAETQTWITYSVKCKYLDREIAAPIHQADDEVIRILVAMINKPECWLLKAKDS
ncbi:MAG TPA: four helix bundle protein [Gemmataceae bacterium]|nr:four helix bundle protein [Gemmataceae bacterium]